MRGVTKQAVTGGRAGNRPEGSWIEGARPQVPRPRDARLAEERGSQAPRRPAPRVAAKACTLRPHANAARRRHAVCMVRGVSARPRRRRRTCSRPNVARARVAARAAGVGVGDEISAFAAACVDELLGAPAGRLDVYLGGRLVAVVVEELRDEHATAFARPQRLTVWANQSGKRHTPTAARRRAEGPKGRMRQGTVNGRTWILSPASTVLYVTSTRYLPGAKSTPVPVFGVHLSKGGPLPATRSR